MEQLEDDIFLDELESRQEEHTSSYKFTKHVARIGDTVISRLFEGHRLQSVLQYYFICIDEASLTERFDQLMDFINHQVRVSRLGQEYLPGLERVIRNAFDEAMRGLTCFI